MQSSKTSVVEGFRVREALECDGPGAGADEDWTVGLVITVYDPGSAELASPAGVIFTAMWTSGGAAAPLGFLVGGWSYFLAFGGEYLVVRPRDYCQVSIHSSLIRHNSLCT